MIPITVPSDVLNSRLSRFRKLLRNKELDCAIIRTLSDFKYFTGTRWFRPALLIPSDGVPKVFLARGEEDGFLERSGLKNIEVVTYTDGGDLMGRVTSAIRSLRARRVGMVFGVERDSYILFYEMFKRANRDVEVVDVGDLLAEMRAVKDGYEVEAIAKAAEVSSRVLEKALGVVKEGISELDVVAEAYSLAFKLGSEEPHIYVNVGPHPRVHAEPLRDSVVRDGVLVTVVVGADFSGYYANTSVSTFVGSSKPDEVKKALTCAMKVYDEAIVLTKSGTRPVQVMNRLDTVYSEYGLLDRRLVGYLHGVGLQVEEFPITTIVPSHRAAELRVGMALALVHPPIMLPKYGTVKIEDTFVVAEEGLRRLTSARGLIY